MLPAFPKFKPIELSDRADVEKITQKYPPYSDFNFASMWSWDTKGEMKLSVLNGNLVVKFTDYLTSKPFYSFLGNNKVNQTAEKLIKLSKKEHLSPTLKLVPNLSVELLNHSKYKIKEDPDNMDYIISVERLKPHDGKNRKLSSRRRMINKLICIALCSVRPIDLNDKTTKEEILRVFLDWEKQRGVKLKNIKHLKEALKRILQLNNQKETLALGLFIDKKFMGYSINEITGNGYALGNFQQADLKSSKASYHLLMQETALYLEKLGCRYINLEQDLGISGLRKWKKSYNPVNYLKKYTVTPV